MIEFSLKIDYTKFMKQPCDEMMQQLADAILNIRYTDLDEEKRLCDSLFDMAKQYDHSYYLCFSHVYLADWYISQSDILTAQEHLHEARSYSVEYDFTDLSLQIYLLQGLCCESLCDEQNALQNYLQAVHIAQQEDQQVMQCILYHNIATAFDRHRGYQEAMVYMQKAFDLIVHIQEDFPNKDYITLRICCSLAELKRNVKAYQEMLELLAFAKELPNDSTQMKQSLINRTFSNYYAESNQKQEALLIAQKIIHCYTSKQYKDKFLMYEILISLYYALKNIEDQSISLTLMEHIVAIDDAKEKEWAKEIQKIRIDYYETYGSQRQALEEYRTYAQLIETCSKDMDQSNVYSFKKVIEFDEIMLDNLNLSKEAHLDDLTQLYNRRYFNKLVSKITAEHVYVLMIDIDFFKEYNDSYGHTMGDRAIKIVSDILKRSIQGHMLVCRYGGDEFLCLCVDQSLEEVNRYIDTINHELHRMNILHSESQCETSLSLSVGYSCGTLNKPNDLDRLIAAADKALYQSKYAGRNTSSYCQIES